MEAEEIYGLMNSKVSKLNSDLQEIANSGVDTTARTSIGTLSTLTTTDKTDLVKAINEVNAKQGGGDSFDVLTSEGDLLYRNATTLERLPKGVAGQVLTMNDGATAPEWSTISAGSIDEIVNAKDYGAIGDGIIDDTVALQNAINASIGKILLISRTDNYYLITSQLSGVSNITIVSNGATLKSGSSRITNSYIKFYQQSNVIINGLVFDLNMANLVPYAPSDYSVGWYNCGLSFDNVENFEVTNCIFKNLYNRSIYVYMCKGVINVANNNFSSPMQSQTQVADHILLASTKATINVCNNRFDNEPYTNPDYGICAIQAYCIDGKLTIDGNYINYIGRNNTGSHRLGAIDFYQDVKNATVSNNTVENIMCNFMRMNACQNINVCQNRITVNTLSDECIVSLGSSFAYEGNYLRNINIHDNVFSTPINNCYCIGGQTDIYDRPYTRINIHNNIFYNFTYPILHKGVFDGYEICNNKFYNASNSGYVIQFSNYSSATGVQSASKIKGLKINDNYIEGYNIAIDINYLNYTGLKDNAYEINCNNIGVRADGIGIVTRAIPTFVNNNVINGGSIGIYLRDNSKAYAFNNLAFSTTGLTVEAITTFVKNNNYNNNALI